MSRRHCLLLAVRLSACTVLLAGFAAIAAEPADDGRKLASFDTDPSWDSHRNRLLTDAPPRVRQEFGLRDTNHAGGRTRGEVGGWIQRSIRPAYFAKTIVEKSLNDRLTASGTFAVTHAEGGSGALFGWFNDKSRGWRTPNSLAFRIDGNGGKYWVFFEYGTRNWLTGGGHTFEGDRYQTTQTKPFSARGEVHHWSLSYDPAGNNGGGLIVFTLDGTDYRRPLEEGHKLDGATFDRFGMFNQQITGDGMDVFFGDLSIDGEAVDLSKKRDWIGLNNDRTYADRAFRPLHDFGYFSTRHAGGKKEGEIGGIMWRDERPAYYADKLGPLSLNHRLHASGKLAFTAAGSDSAVYIGWFDSTSKKNKATPEHQEPQKNVLCIVMEGPSRIGHYFRPAYWTSTGAGGSAEAGPVIRPDGQSHEWSIDYDPVAASGNGRITVTLDGKSQSLDLAPGHRTSGATFDRFGLLNCQAGGHHVEVYLDDLRYTASANAE